MRPQRALLGDLCVSNSPPQRTPPTMPSSRSDAPTTRNAVSLQYSTARGDRWVRLLLGFVGIHSVL